MHQAVDASTPNSVIVSTAHPQAPLLRSTPGLGPILAAQVLAEIGDDAVRFPTPAALRASAGTAPITRRRGVRTTSRHARSATNDSATQAIGGRSRR
ncbi:transposase [Rhodococcus aetherivorans]